MEATIRNLAMAAAKVHPSRTFGCLLPIRNTGTARETRTAKKGFMDRIVSTKYLTRIKMQRNDN
jgi:hypothetical protein